VVMAEKTSHSCDYFPNEGHDHWAHCTLDQACNEVLHVPTCCCMLLVEHRGGQGEEVVVVGGREGGVHVDDIFWWSITPLVHPSTLGSEVVAEGAMIKALQFGQQQSVMN